MASTSRFKVIEDGREKEKLEKELWHSIFGMTPLLGKKRIKQIFGSINPKGQLKAVPTDSSD